MLRQWTQQIYIDLLNIQNQTELDIWMKYFTKFIQTTVFSSLKLKQFKYNLKVTRWNLDLRSSKNKIFAMYWGEKVQNR